MIRYIKNRVDIMTFKNNKIKLLFIIGVILLTIEVSFSFFMASTYIDKNTTPTTSTMVSLEDTKFLIEGKLSINDVSIYPGHRNVSSIKVTATGNNTINYNLVWNGINEISNINYKVYKTTEPIITTTNCIRKTEENNSTTKYYEECNIENIDKLGSIISSGTITSSAEEQNITLKDNETIIATSKGTDLYYYVVLEFPNLDLEQNIDMNKTFDGIVTVESSEIEFEKTKVTFTPSSVKGSSNWYKSVDITGTITGVGETFTGKYCTGNTVCIPTTDLTITDKTFEVSMPSEAYPQVLCVSIKDKYGNTVSECTESYNVDGEKPTGSVSIASSTTGTNNWYKALTLKIEGSDDHSKVASIKHCTTTSTTCTPNLTVNGISANVKFSSNESAQKVCYQIIDTAGNISTTTCSTSYKVDTTLPTVSIASESSTTNSITISVTGNDNHSKIDKYYYKIGSGSYSSSTSASKTFSNLSVGTSYTVYVYAVDKAGHQSTVISKEISTGIGVSNILAKYSKNTSRNGQITAGFKGNTPTTVYSAADDGGTSYVFAGVNPNNWVKLGNIYFRIIRFNGNGSMRLIYSGSGSAQTSGTGTQLGTKTFNTNRDDNMYVGLQYTSGQVHGTGTNSTILGLSNSTDVTTLYGWYNNNIKNTYENLIDTSVGFCSDRDNYTNTSGTTVGGGTGATTTYYGAYIRYLKRSSWQINFTPILKCKNSTDLLKLPVGLITADEYMLAGGGSYASSSYYNTTFWLHTSEYYWTMSPCYYNSGASVLYVHSDGFIVYPATNNKFGVRPVINLKSTTAFENNGADGTSTKPWIVKAP